MADQTLAALRELTEAVMAEFFGNDTNLSKRLIAATNEAQLLLMVQPPNDDLANHPAPVEPGRVERLPDGKPYPTPLAPDESAEHIRGATEMVAPPAEGEVHLLAAWMYRLADERTRSRRRGIRPHPSALTRTGAVIQQQAAVIQQQAAELAECREALRRVRLEQRIPGGFW